MSRCLSIIVLCLWFAASTHAEQDARRYVCLGCTSGMGLATTKLLLARGAQVAVSSRRLAKAQGAVEGYAGGHAFACDAADTDSINAFVTTAADKMGGIDGLLYVPTYMGDDGYGVFQDMLSDGSYYSGIDGQYKMNVVQYIRTVHAALPHLLKSPGGKASVVAFSSIAATGSMFAMSAYGAMKAAADHLTKNWALEFATQGIRFNTIAAGSIYTGVFDDFSGGKQEVKDFLETQFASMHPQQRVGLSSEAGELAAFLLSDKCSFLTGQVIPLDGGITGTHMASPGMSIMQPVPNSQRFWFGKKDKSATAGKQEL